MGKTNQSLTMEESVARNMAREKRLMDERARTSGFHLLKKAVAHHWQMYLIFLFPVIYLLVFHYYPMYGAQIAFRDFAITNGITGSPWVGLKHFQKFLGSYQFPRLLSNTLIISVYSIVASFPFPIILAISLNECKRTRMKKIVQLTTYAPYFISTVVIVALINQIFSGNGIINQLLLLLGHEKVSFLSNPDAFIHLYVWSGVWQNTGYNAILYLAALSSINPELYEAAVTDGANTFQKILYIDIPSIIPTATILLILSTGRILNVGYEKVLLMQNNVNMRASDIIDTYVYRMGLVSAQYSFATAVQLFKSIVSLALIVTINKISRTVSDNSLW